MPRGELDPTNAGHNRCKTGLAPDFEHELLLEVLVGGNLAKLLLDLLLLATSSVVRTSIYYDTTRPARPYECMA